MLIFVLFSQEFLTRIEVKILSSGNTIQFHFMYSSCYVYGMSAITLFSKLGGYMNKVSRNRLAHYCTQLQSCHLLTLKCFTQFVWAITYDLVFWGW